MKRIFTLCITLLTVFGLAVTDAEAKRFGGGMSIGKQRQSYAQPAPMQRPAAPAPAPVQAPSGGGKWLGPLAGFAAGGLLASMFMGGGGGGGIFLILLLAAAVFMILRMLKRPEPVPMQYAGMGHETVIAPPPSQSIGGAGGGNIPAGFDMSAFIHHAKVNFVRLQAAYDAGNLQDIREFTTPEMYGEISQQFRDRGATSQQTDVVSLSADLLDVSSEGRWHVASVRFTGLIRENPGEPAVNFDEIWHLQKPVSGETGWVVAGIQQVH